MRSRMRLLFVLLITLASLAVRAADEPKKAPAEHENIFKRTGRQVGHDAKAATKQAGHAFKELGKDIGHGTSKAVKDIGRGMKESAAKTEKAAK